MARRVGASWCERTSTSAARRLKSRSVSRPDFVFGRANPSFGSAWCGRRGMGRSRFAWSCAGWTCWRRARSRGQAAVQGHRRNATLEMTTRLPWTPAATTSGLDCERETTPPSQGAGGTTGAGGMTGSGGNPTPTRRGGLLGCPLDRQLDRARQLLLGRRGRRPSRVCRRRLDTSVNRRVRRPLRPHRDCHLQGDAGRVLRRSAKPSTAPIEPTTDGQLVIDRSSSPATYLMEGHTT